MSRRIKNGVELGPEGRPSLLRYLHTLLEMKTIGWDHVTPYLVFCVVAYAWGDLLFGVLVIITPSPELSADLAPCPTVTLARSGHFKHYPRG